MYPLKMGKTPNKKVRPKYDIKLYLMVRLQLWRSEENKVLIYCCYSQVHPEMAPVIAQIELSKNQSCSISIKQPKIGWKVNQS